MTFKTNTARLWIGGQRTLPTVANEFAYFSNAVDTLRDHGPEFSSGVAEGAMTALGREWDVLATQLQRAQAKTAANLRGTGRALVAFAEEIDDNDAAASAEIAKAKRNLDDIEQPKITEVYPKDEEPDVELSQ